MDVAVVSGIAITVDASQTVCRAHLLFLHCISGVVAGCRDVVASSTSSTLKGNIL